MKCSRSASAVLFSLATMVPVVASLASFSGLALAAEAKSKKSPVVGVVTDGAAERIGGTGKAKKGHKKGKSGVAIGTTLTALCDGALASWKLTELGDDGAWVGSFNGAAGRPKHCMLLDAPSDPQMAAHGRATASQHQIDAAKAAAMTALTPKKGDAPAKVDLVVFNDGEGFIAVAQASHPSTGKSDCLDITGLVVMEESDKGWKTVFRPSAKGKGVCGYTFFTRGDVDADGRDEIALRVEKTEGYAYRVLKRRKGTYSVIAK